MIESSFKVSKNFAIDLNFIHKFRTIGDGLSLFELNIDTDWFHGDHNPQFSILFVLFNIAIVDICLYNIHHVEDEDELFNPRPEW